MDVLAWIGIGSLLGSFASVLSSAVNARDVLLNIGVGIAGAVCGGFILTGVGGLTIFPQANFSRLATAALMGFTVLLLIVFNLILHIVRGPPVAHLPSDRR